MADLETEYEHQLYMNGFNQGMLDTVVLACDRVLSVLKHDDRIMALNYLATKRQPEEDNE